MLMREKNVTTVTKTIEFSITRGCMLTRKLRLLYIPIWRPYQAFFYLKLTKNDGSCYENYNKRI